MFFFHISGEQTKAQKNQSSDQWNNDVGIRRKDLGFFMQENAIDFVISFTKNIKRYLEKMAFFYTLCDGHRLILGCMVLAGYGFLRRRQTITQKSPWNYSFVTRIGSLTRGGEIPESFQKERKNVTMCFKSLANSSQLTERRKERAEM